MDREHKLFPADWQKPESGGFARCLVCPRHCLIADGHTGFCGVRLNRGGKIYSMAYGYPCALQIDPIDSPANCFARSSISRAARLVKVNSNRFSGGIPCSIR